jgi:hypothetical protein
MAETSPHTPSEVIDIGSRLELFVDDWLVESMDGLSLQLQHPVPQEVALEFNSPWEGALSSDQVVIKDGDRYRMWYGGRWTRDTKPAPNVIVYPNQCEAYAESDDGIHWSKPSLGICEFDGSKENNILFLSGLESGLGRQVSVFKDGNPAAPDSERYKAIARGFKTDGGASLRGLVSPDGAENGAVVAHGPCRYPRGIAVERCRAGQQVEVRILPGKGSSVSRATHTP